MLSPLARDQPQEETNPSKSLLEGEHVRWHQQNSDREQCQHLLILIYELYICGRMRTMSFS